MRVCRVCREDIDDYKAMFGPSSSTAHERGSPRYRYHMVSSTPKDDGAVGVAEASERGMSGDQVRGIGGDAVGDAATLPWKEQVRSDLKLSKHRETYVPLLQCSMLGKAP